MSYSAIEMPDRNRVLDCSNIRECGRERKDGRHDDRLDRPDSATSDQSSVSIEVDVKGDNRRTLKPFAHKR